MQHNSTERSGLKNPDMVECLQDLYMDVLTKYVKLRRGKRHRIHLAHILMSLCLLRSAGYKHSQFLYKLTLQIGSLPPLLTEYFNIG